MLKFCCFIKLLFENNMDKIFKFIYGFLPLKIDGGSLSNYRGLNGDTPADSVSVRSDANMSLSSLEELASGLMRKVIFFFTPQY